MEKKCFFKNHKNFRYKNTIKIEIKTIDVAKYVLNDTNYNVAKFNINKNGEKTLLVL